MSSDMHGESSVVLRFLDFLTGEVHPLAANPVLTLKASSSPFTGIYMQAEVLGDIVLVHLSPNYFSDLNIPRLCQWYLVEWRTGRVVSVSVPNRLQSLCFLTRPNLY
jgi:hypothetical protein